MILTGMSGASGGEGEGEVETLSGAGLELPDAISRTSAMVGGVMVFAKQKK